MPTVDPVIAPILYTVPVRWLAYYTAVAKGTDVDKPRNLARSVTVELPANENRGPEGPRFVDVL